ncbi:hypothetical protein CDL35_06790 [Escherichia coli]|nr:hypothetical protein CDL35_06790 [Escherichia coli]
MSSGVAVADEVVAKYQELKLGHQHRFVFFKLTDDLKEVVFEKASPPGAKFDEFVAALPPNDCRYAVYDFEYKAEDGGDRGKIVFVLWCPDTSKIKSKMIYTSTKDAIRKKLVGIGTEIQATDKAEIAYDAVLEKVNRK